MPTVEMATGDTRSETKVHGSGVSFVALKLDTAAQDYKMLCSYNHCDYIVHMFTL